MEALKTAHDALVALETARAGLGMSKAELARRGKVPAETVRRLLTSVHANPLLSMVMDLLRPAGLGLFVGKLEVPAEEARPTADLVQAWLAHLGAPLYGSTAVAASDVPAPERVLVEALALARSEAVVARALPVAFYRSRQHLDFRRLRRLAEERGLALVLGFFLELTGELARDRDLVREARPFLPKRRHRKRASQFFRVRSPTERQLAELKTPPVARRWGFRMNMSLDSFASMFNKAVSTAS
jgi:hypothetical protein